MLDFSKLYCSCSSKELVTNFCSKQECQTGLCASCICIHTQSHMNNGSSPEYQNIRTTYKNLNDSVTSQVRNFEDIKARISEVESKSQEKKDKLKEMIILSREEAHRLIDNYFIKKEEELLKEMEAQDKKNQLHCKYRLTAIKNQISKEVSEVIRASQEIDEYNFLQELPRLKNQTLHNAQQVCQQMEEEVVRNECYITSIFYNSHILGQMESVLNQSIGITIQMDLNANCNDNKQKLTKRVPHINQVYHQTHSVPNLNHEHNLKRPNSQTTIKNVHRNENKYNNLFDNDGLRSPSQRQNINRVGLTDMNGVKTYALQKTSNNRLSFDENSGKQNFLKQKSVDYGKQNKLPMPSYRGDLPNYGIETATFSSKPFSVAPKENSTPNKISISRISQKLIPYLNQNKKEEQRKTAQFKQINIGENKIQKKGKNSNSDLLTSFDYSMQGHRFDIAME